MVIEQMLLLAVVVRGVVARGRPELARVELGELGDEERGVGALLDGVGIEALRNDMVGQGGKRVARHDMHPHGGGPTGGKVDSLHA